ncbi:MAG: iron-containing alcohol dehydrogenase [Actinomycetia bacterium]|nr:iron-containing alcohol dehydrogenase [Actinomycetes bacterium]
MFGHLASTSKEFVATAAGLVDDAKDLVAETAELLDSGHLVDEAKIRGLQVGAMIKPPPVPETLTGPLSSARLGEQIVASGAKKVMVVTTAGLKSRGTLDPLLDALSTGGVQSVIFEDVVPDPGFEVVMSGVALYRESGAQAVVAIGGGSAIDAAKAMVACYSNNKEPKELVGMLKVRRQDVPFYAVPTTAGTGSEVTVAAVVTDTEKGAKYGIVSLKIVPSVVALDPTLMVTLPPAITAATGLDALTHAVESFVSPIATGDSRRLSLKAAKTITEKLPLAYVDGTDLEVREELAVASMDAGLAFTRAGVGYVHAISHQLGGMYHMVHGEANAILMPHVMEFYLPKASSQLAQLAVDVGVADPQEDEAVAAAAFIQKLRDLNRELGIPTYAAPLLAKDIPEIAKRALAEADGSYPVPRYMDQQQCEELLAKILPPEPSA